MGKLVVYAGAVVVIVVGMWATLVLTWGHEVSRGLQDL